MKVKVLILLTIIFWGTTILAQTPPSFNYQAVLRDATGNVLANKEVEIEVNLLKDSTSNFSVFTETHAVTTNEFGLMNLQIGSVNTIEMHAIDWTDGPFFIQISVDGTIMGTSQLLSVPFAMHANTVENDAVKDDDSDPQNEIQTISINADTIFLSSGGFVALPPETDPAFTKWDKSAGISISEAQISDLKHFTGDSITGNETAFEGWDKNVADDFTTTDETDPIFSNSLAASITAVDTAQWAKDNDPQNELQHLSLENQLLSISNGNTIDLSEAFIADSGASKNLQDISLNGTLLSITKGSTVDLSEIQDGDKQRLSLGVTNQHEIRLNISNANYVEMPFVKDGVSKYNWDKAENYVAKWEQYGSMGKSTIYDNGNVGIGTETPEAKLEVAGQVKITGGEPGIDKVLYSDANGLAFWQPLPPDSTNSLDGAYDKGNTIIADSGAVIIAGVDGLISTGTFGEGKDLPVSGEGTRMFWYPKKAAFRAGNVNDEQWNADNIGNYSFASGINTTASGEASTAMGNSTAAIGKNSTVIGNNSLASGQNAIALGDSLMSAGKSTFVTGFQAMANGNYAIAMGDSVRARGENAIAMGYDTEASAKGAFASGTHVSALKDYSVAMGNNTTANGINSTVLGKNSLASGENAIALGDSVMAAGKSAFVTGYQAMANGNYAIAMGDSVMASGENSIAMGYDTEAGGKGAFASGTHTSALKDYSVAMGNNTTANGINSTVLGKNSLASGENAIALGDSVMAAGKSAFVTGYQAMASGNYAIALGDSVMASGENSIAMGYDTEASGKGAFASGTHTSALKDYSVAMGNNTTANGINSTVLGKNSLASGENAIALGDSVMAAGKSAFVTGYQAMANGNYAIAMGDSVMASGENSIAMGYDTEASGKGAFASGTHTSALKDYSVAMGNNTTANGINSTVLGKNSLASGENAIALGDSVMAAGKSAFVTGYQAMANGNYAIAMGDSVMASGENSIAMGYDTEAGGKGAFASGTHTSALKDYSVAMGNNTTANGINSTVLGKNSLASGENSIAMGYDTKAKGKGAFAAGTKVTADGNNSTAIGNGVFVTGNSSVGIGLDNTTRYVSKDNTFAIVGGNVGIGVARPAADLHVQGNSCFIGNVSIGAIGKPYFPLKVNTTEDDETERTYAFLRLPTSNLQDYVGKWKDTVSYSIVASGNMRANEFHAISDRRIKTNIKLTSGLTDLDLVKSIEVVDYQYVDKIENGNRTKKGFIAQQVEEVLPSAVGKSPKIIPSIYKKASKIVVDSVENTLTITTPIAHNLKEGDELRFITPGKNHEEKVLSVLSDSCFVVKNVDGDCSEVFVYGKRVNDFRSVDYDQVFSVGIGAIQELSRQNDELKQTIETLQNANTALKAEKDNEVGKLQAENSEIKQRLETLEALMKNTLSTIALENASAQKE